MTRLVIGVEVDGFGGLSECSSGGIGWLGGVLVCGVGCGFLGRGKVPGFMGPVLFVGIVGCFKVEVGEA